MDRIVQLICFEDHCLLDFLQLLDGLDHLPVLFVICLQLAEGSDAWLGCHKARQDFFVLVNKLAFLNVHQALRMGNRLDD